MSNNLWQQAAGRAPDCPSVDDWSAYLDSAADAAKRLRMEEHRRQCAACQAEVAMLTSFLAAQPQPEESADLRYITERLKPAPATMPSATPWWQSLFAPPAFRIWAIAALAMVAVAVGLQWRSTALPPVSQEVGGEMRAGAVVEGVTPSGDLTQPPQRIEWRAVAGAARYQVQILAVDGVELWHSPLTDQLFSAELPVEGVFLVHKTVLLRVTAFAADSKPLATSQDVRLRVLPAASGSK